MRTIKTLYYDGFTITQNENNEFLIEDTYEYFDSLSKAIAAVDLYVSELYPRCQRRNHNGKIES